jgi:hypothetical protein
MLTAFGLEVLRVRDSRCRRSSGRRLPGSRVRGAPGHLLTVSKDRRTRRAKGLRIGGARGLGSRHWRSSDRRCRGLGLQVPMLRGRRGRRSGSGSRPPEVFERRGVRGLFRAHAPSTFGCDVSRVRDAKGSRPEVSKAWRGGREGSSDLTRRTLGVLEPDGQGADGLASSYGSRALRSRKPPRPSGLWD